MFDSEYFRTTLQREVDAVAGGAGGGGGAVVELSLVNGRQHHLRSVLAVQSGYVTLEVYRAGLDRPLEEPRWKDDRGGDDAKGGGGAPRELQRTAVSYESIAAVAITAVRSAAAGRIGFGG